MDTYVETIGARLRKARLQKRLTQPQLARLAGVSQTSISDLERGRATETRKLVQLAQALGKTPEWLESGSLPEERPVLRTLPGPDTLTQAIEDLAQTRRIPVIGTVKAEEDGFLETVDYPAGQGGVVPYHGKDMNAYALRVRGDSMAGKIDSGETIVVEPGTTPQPGDIAMVLMKDGRRTVKRLLYVRNGEVTLAPENRDHHNLVFDLDEIDAMHKVVNIILR